MKHNRYNTEIVIDLSFLNAIKEKRMTPTTKIRI